jgi:phosphatidylglycerophosphatase A
MESQNTNPASLIDRGIVCLATGLYVSTLPTSLLDRFKEKSGGQNLIDKKLTGAGLLGSVEGALTYLFLPARLANAWWLVLIGTGFSVYVAGRAEKVLNSHDDSRIVIDEWIGAWIALWGLEQRISTVFISAFILFRLFDVLKGPIGRRLQYLPGGWGVTMDDVYAGVAANIVWRATIHFFPTL